MSSHSAVIRQHLMKYKEGLPKLVRKIESSYVDDLVAGADNLSNAGKKSIG